MSEKAIVFIDGGWLYKYRTALFTKLGENNFEIDYAKLPRMLCEDVADAIDEDVSLVKTLYFGTIPSSRSGYNTSKQYSFYDFLDRTCGYDTNIHEIDVMPEDVRSAGSSWVDVSMATNIVYYSSLPCVMDIAIIVSDSIDLLPAIRRARSLGKRVQLVGDRHPPSASASSVAVKRRLPGLAPNSSATDAEDATETPEPLCGVLHPVPPLDGMSQTQGFNQP